ncbi:LysR substrate-binding domain-containing protein [soil metagenome]
MHRRLPPLENIQAFIEAARGPNFRAAAERCAISPAAFSRRLQALASRFDRVLFERTADGLRLTEAGARCLRELEPAYQELRRAARAAVGDDVEQTDVRLSLSHSLAVGWLIPRLGDFNDAAPDIRLSFDTIRDGSSLRRGTVDLALCFSDTDFSGLSSRALITVSGTPVASPEVAARFRTNPDLSAFPRLAVSVPVNIWDWWTDQAGLTRLAATTRFDVTQAAYEAAAQGIGIVLGALPTVQPYLDDGRLVELGLPWLKYPGEYRLAATRAGRRRRPVAAVWSWLETQAANTPTAYFPKASRSRSDNLYPATAALSAARVRAPSA